MEYIFVLFTPFKRRAKVLTMQQVLGQEHIVDYLLKCNDNFPHLLFTGSTGVGKTFLSQQFLNYALRDIPGDHKHRYVMKLSSCDDRGIAALRQKLVEFLRSNRKYPILAWVWVDDADSLPVLTQQALRRLMERYENHVRFVFSSCTSQTFIEPIQSRTVIMQLLPVNLNLHCSTLLEKNAPHVILKDEAREWLCAFCLGNVRQFSLLLKLLESLTIGEMKEVDLEDIRLHVSSPPVNAIRALCGGILDNNQLHIFRYLHDLLLNGYTVEDILHYIQVILQVYSFFSPLEIIKINERCSEVHIRLIQRRCGFFETLKVFAGEIQRDELFPFRITTGACPSLDTSFRI